MGTELKELIHLSSNLKERYACDEVNMTINNGSSITATMKNSIYQDSSDEVKQRISNEIGQIILSDEKLKGVKEGHVLFTDEDDNGIVKTSSSEGFDMHLHSR